MIKVEGRRAGETFACSAASMEHQVWTGTMTVGEQEIVGHTFRGWNKFNNYTGANLDNETFTLNGHTYNIEVIHDGAGTGLNLGFDATGSGDIATEATRESLTLHIGNNSYNLGSGTLQSNQRQITWSTNVPTWNQYDRVCLAMTGAPPGRLVGRPHLRPRPRQHLRD